MRQSLVFAAVVLASSVALPWSASAQGQVPPAQPIDPNAPAAPGAPSAGSPSPVDPGARDPLQAPPAAGPSAPGAGSPNEGAPPPSAGTPGKAAPGAASVAAAEGAAAGSPAGQAEAAPAAAVPKAPPPADLRLAGAIGSTDGLGIRTANGDLELLVRGYVYADGRTYLSGRRPTSNPGFSVRYGGILLHLKAYNRVQAKLSADLGGTIMTAWVEGRVHDGLKLRIGKQYVPLGLEESFGSADLQTTEYAYTTKIQPQLDVGAELTGIFGGGILEYHAGIFNGTPDLVNGGNNTDKFVDFAGRVLASPFKGWGPSALQGFGFNIGGLSGRRAGTLANTGLATYKSFGAQTALGFVTNAPATADGTAVADGSLNKAAGGVFYAFGPAAAFGEYAYSSQHVRLGGNTHNVKLRAWQANANVVLTGEKAAYLGNVKPNHPVDKGGPGAFTLAGAISSFSVDEDTFKLGFANPKNSALRTTTAVATLHWIPVTNVRLSAAYANTWFDAYGDNEKLNLEQVVAVRSQIIF